MARATALPPASPGSAADPQVIDRMRALRRALEAIRVRPGLSEADLHALVASALTGCGFDVSHEAQLASGCRIDFLVGAIGIEIKKQRPSKGRLLAQCARYLAQPSLAGLILVLEKSIALPPEIGGKPILVCGLNRLWGVALP